MPKNVLFRDYPSPNLRFDLDYYEWFENGSSGIFSLIERSKENFQKRPRNMLSNQPSTSSSHEYGQQQHSKNHSSKVKETVKEIGHEISPEEYLQTVGEGNSPRSSAPSPLRMPLQQVFNTSNTSTPSLNEDCHEMELDSSPKKKRVELLPFEVSIL